MLNYRALEEWSELDFDKTTGSKNGVTSRLLLIWIAICNLREHELTYSNIKRKVSQLFGWKMSTASLSRNMNYLTKGVKRLWDTSYEHPKGTGARFNLIRLVKNEHDERSNTIKFTQNGMRLRRIFLETIESKEEK